MIMRSNPYINYNEFNGENGILLANSCGSDQNEPIINNNNFNIDIIFIKLENLNQKDVDATCNYFYTINPEEISERIIDYNDYPELVLGKVILQTFKTNIIPNYWVE